MALSNYLLLLVSLGTVLAKCDHRKNLSPGSSYEIESPKYPKNYKGDEKCTWSTETKEGYILKLTCDNFNLPKSSSCSGDHVTVSPTGDSKLKDGQIFCGDVGPLVISKANKLTVELSSVDDTEGGTFRCNISSIPKSSACNCGWKKENRILGGVETGINEYPMMAALVQKPKNNPFCGADIISSSYVLTAAHCVGNVRQEDIAVLVGDHDITSGDDTSASKIYQIAKMKIHPEYDDEEFHNDIALVKVDTPIAMSEDVLPVCLPFQYTEKDFTGEEVTLLGWGRVKDEGATSNVLLKVNVNVSPLDKCKSEIAEYFKDVVTSNNICTYAQGKDSCQGDSGGPVLWYNATTGREYQIGVTSFGLGCGGDTPSVNARVTSYLDWITSNTPEDDLCKDV